MDGSRYRRRDCSPSSQIGLTPNDCSAATSSSKTASKDPYNLRLRNPKRVRSSISLKSSTYSTSSSSVAICHNPTKYSRRASDTEEIKVVAQDSSSEVEIVPTKVKNRIKFNEIGGLEQHLEQLKEMILLPRLYPQLCNRISSPRGVLFHGPPGTGKTLVARALANEFRQGKCKMTFFARKAADCLSKWLGESEKQLRQLFDKAYEMRPSIIFFDEIDGLAPSRSHSQDQVHHSIVTTLLALMDGLEDRGQVIVIGATNRIDSIDPALRRPGRFDREFYFPLPSLEARRSIIRIHTKKWKPPLSEAQIENIALDSTGYCGADLKALCAEATLVCLRRCYPNLCALGVKTVIDKGNIHVLPQDFKTAMNKIVPAIKRQATSSLFGPIPSNLKPLLQDTFSKAVSTAKALFGTIKQDAKNKSQNNRGLANIYRPRVLITGRKDQGQTKYIAPAILHYFENVPNHTIDLPNICASFDQNAERYCVQIFQEAKRNMPSIIYFPSIESTWSALTYIQRQNLLLLVRNIPSEAPIMILATSDCPFERLPPAIRELFDGRKDVVSMQNPSCEERQKFFSELVMEILVIPGVCGKSVPLQTQPVQLFNLKEDDVARRDRRDSCPESHENKQDSKVCINKNRLKAIKKRLVVLTKDWTIADMEKLGNSVANLIHNHRMELDKSTLLDNIEEEIQNSSKDH